MSHTPSTITQPIVASPPPPHPRPDPLSAARTFFRGLQIEDVYDFTHDKGDLVRRAVKVFLMSYPEFGPDTPQDDPTWDRLYEFVDVINEVYEAHVPNLQFVHNIWTLCSRCRVAVVFAVKQFSGRTFIQETDEFLSCDEPSIYIYTLTDQQTSYVIPLTMGRDEQHNATPMIIYDFDTFRTIRRQDWAFHLRFQANQWNPTWIEICEQNDIEALTDVVVHIGDIHPEGHQMWYNVGRGISLLVEVTWRVISESGVNSKTAGKFHLQTIARMVGKRLQVVEAQNPSIAWHMHKTKLNISLLFRDLLVDPEDKFWWRTNDVDWAALQLYASTGHSRFPPNSLVMGALTKKVSFVDFQRSVTYGQDFEDLVCICNEWCNWNAFFHHNHPVYRFLLVMHNILFLRDKLNVPEMYMFAPAGWAAMPPHPLPKMPLLQLIVSGNQMRVKYNETYFKSHPDHAMLQMDHSYSRPSPNLMVGVTYNLFRYDIPVVILCHQLNHNPMADICVKNLLDCYKVLQDLHHYIKGLTTFVRQAEKRRWQDEFETQSRVMIKEFVINSVDDMLSNVNAIVYPNPNNPEGEPIAIPAEYRDTMFGSDMEYLNYVPKNAEQAEIKFRRIRGLRAGPNGNILNIDVSLDSFTNCFVHVYKFFTRIEPQFSTARNRQAKRDINEYCLEIDQNFVSQHQMPSFRLNTYQMLDAMYQNNLNEQQFYALYTFKLYAFGFAIQKFCINAHINYLLTEDPILELGCEGFAFIWDIVAIEDNYRNRYNEDLYSVDHNVPQAIHRFYVVFWGLSNHEQDPGKAQAEYSFTCQSANMMTTKRFLWERINGNNRLRFTSIIQAFTHKMTAITDRTGHLHNTILLQIFAVLHERYNQYDTEVMDVMVLYLVRAACFNIMTIMAQLFQTLHSRIQVPILCNYAISYAMMKPGWVHILKTRNAIETALDVLRTQYIIFDDECERIDRTLDDTQQTAKKVYRLVYSKITMEWINEEIMILNRTQQLNIPMLAQVLVFHLACGLSLGAAFHESYRLIWNRRRKIMFTMLRMPRPQPPIGPLAQYEQFLDCRQLVTQYLNDPQAIDAAEPFNNPIWYQHIMQRFPHLNVFTPANVGIDMAQADLV